MGRKDPIATVKYGGGSIMLWGYVDSTGPRALVKVNSIMNFTQYQDILAQNLIASARNLAVSGSSSKIFTPTESRVAPLVEHGTCNTRVVGSISMGDLYERV